MKKILVTLVSLTVAVSAFAQGQFLFLNRLVGEFDATIFGLQANTLYQGQGSNNVPGGMVGGVPGTPTYALTAANSVRVGYTAQFFGGAQGTAPAQMQALTPTTTFVTTTSGGGRVLQPADAVTVPGVGEGSVATLQLRAWANPTGNVTWDDVLRDDSIPRGYSLPFDLKLGGGSLPTPNPGGATFTGLQSFNLFIVPEPSVIALGVLGVGALILFRRRRN